MRETIMKSWQDGPPHVDNIEGQAHLQGRVTGAQHVSFVYRL